jgi:hypothetical protein
MSLTKKTFVLRINDETFSALAKWAEDEFRSVNGQIEMILDKALKDVGRNKGQTDIVKLKTKQSKVERQ